MKIVQGMAIGALILGCLVPAFCHFHEILELAARLPFEELVVTALSLYGSTKGAISGALIGACAGANS